MQQSLNLRQDRLSHCHRGIECRVGVGAQRRAHHCIVIARPPAFFAGGRSNPVFPGLLCLARCARKARNDGVSRDCRDLVLPYLESDLIDIDMVVVR